MNKKETREFFKELKNGKIIAVCGCMNSGKSDAVLRYIDTFSVADQRYLAFKSKLDTRDQGKIKSKRGKCTEKNVFWINGVSDFEEIFKEQVGMKFRKYSSEIDLKYFVKIAKRLKKNNTAVDVISFGETMENDDKLQAFHNAVNNNGNSSLLSVPPGPHNLSDFLNSFPSVLSSDPSSSDGNGFVMRCYIV